MWQILNYIAGIFHQSQTFFLLKSVSVVYKYIIQNIYTEYTARGVSIYTMLVDIFSENMRKALAFVSLNLFFFDVLLYYMIQNIYHARLLLLQSKIKI